MTDFISPPNILRSAGSVALAAAASTSAAAAALNVSERIVTMWRSGARVPSRGSREKLHAVYGIDQRAWDERSGTEPARPTEPADGPHTDANPDAAEGFRAQLRRIAKLRENADLTVSQHIDLEKAEVSARRALAAVESTRLSTAAIRRAPAFVAIVERMTACFGDRLMLFLQLGAALADEPSEAASARARLEALRAEHPAEVAAVEAAERALAAACRPPVAA